MTFLIYYTVRYDFGLLRGISAAADELRIRKPAKRATAQTINCCRPLRGLVNHFVAYPGADAPGFTLTPASQA